jgi:hypothetical protein
MFRFKELTIEVDNRPIQIEILEGHPNAWGDIIFTIDLKSQGRALYVIKPNEPIDYTNAIKNLPESEQVLFTQVVKAIKQHFQY